VNDALSTALRDGARLAALRESDLLDSPSEERYDRITRLVRHLLDVPVALVSLVDDRRQFFKSQQGLAEPWAARRGTPLSHSFCQHVVATGAVLAVEDAREHPLVRENGAVRDIGVVAYLGAPVRAPNGEPLGSLCAIDTEPRAWTAEDEAALRDLAASVESEVALRTELGRRTRSEARYQALFDGSPDAVLLLEPETERILDANPAACALYGRVREDLVGRSAKEFSESVELGEDVARQLVEDGGVARFDSVQRRRDGTPFHVQISASAVDVGGRRVVFSVNRDVTEQVRAEAALAEQTAELQALVDHTPDLIARFGRDLRYQFVNRTAARALGLDARAFLGRTPAEMGLDPAESARHLADVRAVFETGRSREAEYAAPVRGRPVHLHVRIVPERGADGRFETVLVVARDVTAQREAEAAYRATRAQADRLALVAAKTTNGIVVTDADGRVEWVNEGFTRVSGYALDELRGRKPGHLLQGPGTDPETVAFVRERVRAREPFAAELVNYHKSGEPYWIRIEVSPLVEDDGALTGFIAIETDVTERKRAEAELRESEERFRLVTETAGVGLFLWDEEAGRTSFSLPGQALLGYEEPEPFTFARFNELVHPDDRAAVGAVVAQAKDPAGPGRVHLDHRIVRPETGEVRWVSVLAEAVFEGVGPDRRAVRLCGVIVDATERRRSEAELRASEARYRDLVETVRDAVLQADAEGRWTYLNPAWERITGFSAAESLGRSNFDFVHPDDHGAHGAAFRALFEGQVPFVRHECRFLTKAGGVRHVEVHAQLRRDASGAVVGTAGTVTDVTDTVRFEAEREARERTEEMLRLKTAFLDNMSHEIRTPLTGILGWAEVLAEEVGEAHREPAETIVRGARRLRDTLVSVLDLAQIEAGQFALDPRPVCLRAEASDVVAVLAEAARQRGLALRLSGRPARALADGAAVGRVLHNLVGNALKFTEAGGVTVRTGTDADGAWLRVSDTGIGIDPAFLPRLFDEFAQASTGHGRTHEGNGLGLAITHKLVGLMGGTITVESVPGRGTAFTVRLPAAGPLAGAGGPAVWVAGGASASVPVAASTSRSLL
jgi:PAS domain S-box-containing protein